MGLTEMFKKSKAQEKLEKELENYNKYLKKLKKANPKKASEYEKYTAPLIFAIGNATTDIKNSINTQTIVMAICFVGLGIVVAVT